MYQFSLVLSSKKRFWGNFACYMRVVFVRIRRTKTVSLQGNSQ